MEKNRFKETLLDRKQFIYTLELVPGRGSRGKTQDEIMKIAEKAANSNLIQALSITDNPGGHPALSPNMLGLEISRLGIEPLIHFTCKDKNRNQIESILYSLDRNGLSNLFVMTGDFPHYGFKGKAKPVFDIDSVQLVQLINQMNRGLDIDGKAPGGGVRVPPTHFFKGCNVSPFKKYESEVMAQYYHHLAFAADAPLYRLAKWFFRKIDGTRLEHPVTELEYWVKFISSRCRRCGDCTLPEVAFLCPQSQCPKVYDKEVIMSLESFEEIINFALEKEKEANAFYEQLSNEEPYAGTKEIFQEFAREEKKHQVMLEEFLKDKEKIAAYRFERIPDLKISDYLVDVVYKKGMYYTDVLRLAMKREEKSVKLYNELAKQTDKEDLMRIFHMLSQEEAKHKLGLETLYDAYMAKQGG